MNEIIQQLMSPSEGADAITRWQAMGLFIHAILIGTFLMLLAFWTNRKVGNPSESDSVLASATVLFICVGMTAVMILVNNSIARAFAIAAAIALVRFRVKFAGKFLGVMLFYGVLTGMACGVNRLDIAWAVAAIFGALLSAVMFWRSRTVKRLP